jgi:hypothetical protein
VLFTKAVIQSHRADIGESFFKVVLGRAVHFSAPPPDIKRAIMFPDRQRNGSGVRAHFASGPVGIHIS